jgi:hypothetical protein
MELVKKTKDYSIFKKRSQRYAVKDASHDWVCGDEKVKILLKEKLIKAVMPKPKPAKEENTAAKAEEKTEQEPKEKAKEEETKQQGKE